MAPAPRAKWDMRAKLAGIGAVDVAGMRISTARIADEQALKAVVQILSENLLCSMSTVTAQHRAHISTAYFCFSEELVLYFLTHPGSMHCRNLLANSSMAVAVFSSSQNWADPDKGLQLFGTCNMTDGNESVRAERLYAERFPAYVEWRRQLRGEDLPLAYRFYGFVAEKVKILEEREFGDAVFVCGSVNRREGSA